MISDLFLRLYYTFINNMENQTRYFFIQAIFYLIPAAAAFEFLSVRGDKKRRLFVFITYAAIFLISCILSFRPKWNKPEYELFAKIVAQDSREPKYIFKLNDRDGGGVLERDLRSSYYAGIFTNDSIHNLEELKSAGVCYVIVEDLPSTDPSFKLIAESKAHNNRIFLYEKMVITE